MQYKGGKCKVLSAIMTAQGVKRNFIWHAFTHRVQLKVGFTIALYKAMEGNMDFYLIFFSI